MANKISVIVSTCELDNGYIFKNYFAFNSLRGRPVVTFIGDKIIAGNRTVDDQLYGGGYLYGDEINLVWDENIPPERRHVSLTFDATRLQNALSKIRKKDPARITITQLREANNTYNFDGSASSDEFTIYVSCGVGGDGREGLKSVPANRVPPDNTLIRYPEKLKSSLLVIPVRQFRSMIDSFSKCKRESILMRFYTNIQHVNGKEVKGRSGFVITTEGTSQSGRIFEKFGEVPDEDNNQPMAVPAIQFNNLKIDESAVVRMGTGTQPILEIEKIPEPNEYIINADKILAFSRMSSMHNEGNVRIEYHQSHHLRISHRFGAFGECELCLYNPHVKFEGQIDQKQTPTGTIQSAFSISYKN
jgi:hypothetical protein